MLGKASSLQVKLLSSDYRLGEEINIWLAENQDVDVIDIKFSSSATSDEWGNDALIIYKIK